MAKSETNFKSGFVKGEKEFGMKKVNDCGKVTWYVGYFRGDSFEETYVSRFRKFAWMAYERAFDNPHGLGLTKDGEEEISESRNILVESARIARGKVVDVATISGQQLDALIFPGGTGMAKNIFD